MNEAGDISIHNEGSYSDFGLLESSESAGLSISSNKSGYICSNCKCTFGSNLAINKCIMCGSTNLSGGEINLSSAKFIPFYKNISNAIADYKQKTKSLFLPKVFRRKTVINNIKKVYLPAYLVDVNVSGQVQFLGADKINKNETKKYELIYDTNFDFNNILVCGYSKIKDNIFNSICTYQYDSLSSFNDDLLNDTYSISYDLVPLEVSNKINNRVMRHCLGEVRENIPHALKKNQKNDMDVQIKRNNKVYVPIYIMNINYNGRDYMYIMNGQSGDSYIELEYSKVAIIVYSLIIFTIIFTCAFLFAYFF